MSTLDRIGAVVGPLVSDVGLSVYDIEFNKGVVRVTVEGEGGGTDLDDLARLSRTISNALDESDPVAGRYTLEVSSPGLERRLRRPDHFVGAVGETITLKTHPGVAGDRRVRGTLTEADDDGVVVRPEAEGDEDPAPRHLAYDDIARATTVFEWGPTDRPDPSRSPRKAAS